MGEKETVQFSIIVPVYNRPQEVRELLESLTEQSYKNFEVIIVEDGSTVTCEHETREFKEKLDIKYFYKENSGRSETRNFGVQKASGDYLLFFDSDCMLPAEYMAVVSSYLSENFADCFGGPDTFHSSFSNTQKAINHAMTSFLTTGGIRGRSKKNNKQFYPRSFNMGVSRKAFEATGGFRDMLGEDIDLSIRIIEKGYKTVLIPEAYVWHKRRTNFRQFLRQVFNFGTARASLRKIYPKTFRVIHLLPTIFTVSILLSIFLSIFLSIYFLTPFLFFILLVFAEALLKYRNSETAFKAIIASFIQLIGYGTGFIYGVWRTDILKKTQGRDFLRKVYK